MAVDIDFKEFDSAEDLKVYFKKQRAKAANEEAEREVDRQELEARAGFFEYRANRAALEVAKRDALDKYPLAKDFAEMITGRTPEEITNAAKTMHERLEVKLQSSEQQKQAAEQQELANRQAAATAYGQPAAATGGQQPAAPALSARKEAYMRYQSKLAKGEGLMKPGDKMDVIIGGSERLREAIEFQQVAHPELELGVGGSYRGEGPSSDRKLVDARVQQRRERARPQ